MTSVTVASGTVYVGLDYHDSVVQVCVMDPRGTMLANRPCGNIASEIVRVVRTHGSDVQVAIEACCGSAALADELLAAGMRVSLAHAGYVQRMKQSPDKTDWSDARVLADLLRVGYLPHVWLPPASLRQLRHLVRHRQKLAQQRRAAKQRVTALLRTHRIAFSGSRWTKRWIKAVRECAALGEHGLWVINQIFEEIERVQEQIDRVEARLEDALKGDAFVETLMAMKGIGLVTAATMRAELGEMSRFRSGKQLSRFCGLSPRNASSGPRQADAGLIKASNPQLRTVLIEAAHRLQRSDSHWAALGAQMKRRGKPGSVVAAAIANRWVRRLYHQLKDIQAI
jgi:transposase